MNTSSRYLQYFVAVFIYVQLENSADIYSSQEIQRGIINSEKNGNHFADLYREEQAKLKNVKEKNSETKTTFEIIISSVELEQEKKIFRSLLNKIPNDRDRGLMEGRLDIMIVRMIKAERQCLQQTFFLGRENKEKESAVEDAAFLEFMTHIRSKSEMFKDEMMKHIGFKIDDRDINAYTKIILEKLEKIEVIKGSSTTALYPPPQELLRGGKHYRQWILILHFADKRASQQLELLRKLLGYDRQQYHTFAMGMQRLYAIFSKDHHAKLLYVKYMQKKYFNKYLELLSEELRSAIDVFIRSENTES